MVRTSVVEEFLAAPGPAVLQAASIPGGATSCQGDSGSGVEICRVPRTWRTEWRPDRPRRLVGKSLRDDLNEGATFSLSQCHETRVEAFTE
jgi:hypothetical protein